jgi:hypothetical protein
MSNSFIFRSPPQKDKGEWPTPVRQTIRNPKQQGKSQREIVSDTSIPRRTVRRILLQEHSRRERRKKAPKPHVMSVRQIRQCIPHISKDWSTRRLTFEQVHTQLGIEASARTIRRELRRAGYRRCIACPRPIYHANKLRRDWAWRLSIGGGEHPTMLLLGKMGELEATGGRL